MSLELTPDQLRQIESLGLSLDSVSATPSKRKISLTIPLISISGLSLLSVGGFYLLHASSTAPQKPLESSVPKVNLLPSPTQVPKSIQHYLLTSQQYFTQAISEQKQDTPSTVSLLNQSILTASSAIKEFPDDYRGYEQRGRIYQSLLDSQPQLASAALADFTVAFKLNPSSPDITRSLASVYARQGDISQTINYLSDTINLDPTKAQNFYDLAKLQQQAGLLPQSLTTYQKLLTLVSDPTQISSLNQEISAIQSLISQNPVAQNITPSTSASTPSPQPSLFLPDSPTLIQASAGGGVIIAAPETVKKVALDSTSESNSLSGNATLSAHTTSISFQNKALTPDSQVYLSPISGGKNLNLHLISRSGTTFVVGLDSPTNEDIVFKWWIVK